MDKQMNLDDLLLEFLEEQEPLGIDFQKIMDDNMIDLYEY